VSFAAIALCIASQLVFIVIFRYRLSPETFGYTLVFELQLHDEDLRTLYASPNIIRMIK